MEMIPSGKWYRSLIWRCLLLFEMRVLSRTWIPEVGRLFLILHHRTDLYWEQQMSGKKTRRGGGDEWNMEKRETEVNTKVKTRLWPSRFSWTLKVKCHCRKCGQNSPPAPPNELPLMPPKPEKPPPPAPNRSARLTVIKNRWDEAEIAEEISEREGTKDQ